MRYLTIKRENGRLFIVVELAGGGYVAVTVAVAGSIAVGFIGFDATICTH